jgi:hypothetical protein
MGFWLKSLPCLFFWSVLLREADQKEWPVCFLLQDTTLNSAGLVLEHWQMAVF